MKNVLKIIIALSLATTLTSCGISFGVESRRSSNWSSDSSSNSTREEVNLSEDISDVNKIKKEIGIRKNKMRNVQVSSKWIIRWLWVNYGIFVLGFFTLGFFSDNKIVRINFVLDVLICIISLILNFLLFRKRYQITFLGKITLLFLTFCFMAFTYFAFLTSGNGLPPALFM